MVGRRVAAKLSRTRYELLARILLWHAHRTLRGVPLPTLLSRPPPVQLTSLAQLQQLRAPLFVLLLAGPNPCLPRSVILFQQLRGLGLQPSLVIGVPPEKLATGSQFSAHAWLELQGQPYAETPGFRPQNWLEVFRHPPANLLDANHSSSGKPD